METNAFVMLKPNEKLKIFAAEALKSGFVFREWISKRREEIRPWGTFVKTTNFEAPSSFPKLTKRLYKNVEYFQSNYVSPAWLVLDLDGNNCHPLGSLVMSQFSSLYSHR